MISVNKSMAEESKESVLYNTASHISDVQNCVEFLAGKLIRNCDKHDYTKLDYFEDFYYQLTRNKAHLKDSDWWELHLTERHHLNDSVPEDVNLLDVLEMIADGCVAGAAREGLDAVYPVNIPTEVLLKAVQNTQKLLLDNIEVVDG